MLRSLSIALLAGVLAAAPTSSRAASCESAPELTLDEGLAARWNDCYGAPGSSTTLAPTCDANEGTPYPLVLSFRPSHDVPDFVGLSMRVRVFAGTSRIPDWWQVGAGGCRANGIDFPSLTHPVTASACTPIFTSASSGGGWIGEAQTLPTQYQIRMDLALSSPRAIEGGRWYNAGTIAVTRDKSFGPDACSGCSEPVCIFFMDAEVYSVSLGMVERIGESFAGPSQLAGWSGGMPFLSDCGVTCNALPPCPTRNATWGQMKALYR